MPGPSGFSSITSIAKKATVIVQAIPMNTCVKVAIEAPSSTREERELAGQSAGTFANTKAPNTATSIVLISVRTKFMVPIAEPR